jgi:hypothetical protein
MDFTGDPLSGRTALIAAGFLEFFNLHRFWVWGWERSIEREYYVCAICQYEENEGI